MGKPLTDEQIAREDEFLEGIPRINIGALFLPPIWGPAHGIWLTILYYPAWVFADNCIFSAYSFQTLPTILAALVVVVVLAVITVVFAIVSQPMAAHRAAERGKTKEEYLSAQRKWAIGCVIGGLVMIAFATYYNLAIRPPFA